MSSVAGDDTGGELGALVLVLMRRLGGGHVELVVHAVLHALQHGGCATPRDGVADPGDRLQVLDLFSKGSEGIAHARLQVAHSGL